MLAWLHGKVGKRVSRRPDPGGKDGDPDVYCAEQSPTPPGIFPKVEVGIFGEVRLKIFRALEPLYSAQLLCACFFMS